jgi:predicted nucleic acid-binding protein
MKLTVDASVAVKWFFADAEDERDTALAVDLLKAIRADKHQLLQPVHWLIEVYAVVVRRSSPEAASHALKILHALEFEIIDDEIFQAKAGLLSQRYDHHLFDTLYHAVALERDSLLVTTDERYWNKAKPEGRIVLLKDFNIRSEMDDSEPVE